MRQARRILVCAALTASIGGCAAPAVIATAGFGAIQTGTEAFIRGELEAAVAHPLDEVFAASEAALYELQFPLKSSKLNQFNGYINARESQGRGVDVDLEKKSPIVTKINVRVGLFGDQAISRLILSTIQARLAAHSPHATGPD